MHRRPVAGCAYRSPEPNIPQYPLALPSAPDHLRAWQIRDIAPGLVGKPIRISHNNNGGIFTNPLNPDQKIKTDLPLFGAKPLGYITHTWVNHKDNSLHWAGIIEYDPQSLLASTITTAYPECSLQHYSSTRTSPAIPDEISLCHRGKRPQSNVSWQDDIHTYMRQTGYMQYTPSTPIMADATTPGPEAMQTSASNAPPLATIQQQFDPEAARIAAYDAALGATPDIIQKELLRLLAEQKETAELTRTLKEQASARNLEYIGSIMNIMTEMGLDTKTLETSNKEIQPMLVAASNASSEDARALWKYINNLSGFLEKAAKKQAPAMATPTTTTTAPPPRQRYTRPGDPLPEDDAISAKRRADILSNLAAPRQPHVPIPSLPPPPQYQNTPISESIRVSSSAATDADRATLLSALQRFQYRGSHGPIVLNSSLSKPLPPSENILFDAGKDTSKAVKP